MVERPSTKARPSRHGIRLEVDDVLYGVGELQRRTVPIARHVRKRNSRRGPVPRKLDLDPDGTQRCYVCKEDLSLFAFSADASRSSGIMSRCKKCNRKRAQAHAASPEGRSSIVAINFFVHTTSHQSLIRRCSRLRKVNALSADDHPERVHAEHSTSTMTIIIKGRAVFSVVHAIVLSDYSRTIRRYFIEPHST